MEHSFQSIMCLKMKSLFPITFLLKKFCFFQISLWCFQVWLSFVILLGLFGSLESVHLCFHYFWRIPSHYFFFRLIYWLHQGLHCCMQASSNCGKQGLLSSCGAWTSHFGGFSCWGAPALGRRGFSSSL